MKKCILISAVLAMIGTSVFAQQSFDFSRRNIISPEISSSNTVTFKLLAPNAKEVKVSGDWIPSEGWIPGSKSLTKDENGIWSYTTEPLASELYSYSFNVDGLKVLDPNNVYANRDIANVMNIFIISGGQADLYKVSNVPHGSVTRTWYNSETLGVSRRLTIYTPPGYEGNTEKYPVFYLLHGAGGDEEAWMALGRASQILDNLIAQGKASPMIVVMPNGHTANTSAPGESDKGLYKPDMSTMMRSGFAGEMESSFKDIIKFVESTYRVKADKENRAIAGLSMGGLHSMVISANYPNTFDYVGLFSAATGIDPRNNAEMYKDFDAKLKKQKENGLKLYWIGMGKSDFLYNSGTEFCKKLDGIGMEYTYRESDGGHIWKNWRIYLTEFVPLLFK